MQLNVIPQEPAPVKHKPIEAVTICVNYADFLSYTLPWNKPLLDRWIIVTSKGDLATRRLCEYHGVQCVLTEDFYLNGDAFNKAKGINAGFAQLGGKDWVLHLDADIILPPLFQRTLDRIDLDPETLYSIDRMDCLGADAWDSFVASPTIQMEAGVFVHFDPFPMLPRIYQPERGGYVPIGYFQLFHSQAKALGGKLQYPTDSGMADRTDMQFALQWPGINRRLLPEFIAIHLSSSPEASANWAGRRTPEFWKRRKL